MNKVILSGNLGQDAELKITASGNAVCKLRIATTERYLDRNNQQQERTNWHSVTLFGKRGESLAPYLRKGDRVNIEGRIEYSSYEKDGVKHYATDIVCTDIELLSAKKEGQSTTKPHEPPADPAAEFPV